MRLLITGCCGFVGIRLLEYFTSHFTDELQLLGVDNLSRPGSERNRAAAVKFCQRFFHGDLRLASDLEGLPPVDWVIDASANASVLSGTANLTSSRQLIESNLISTFNILEFCKRRRSGLVLLSSSRVYSIESMLQLPLHDQRDHFALNDQAALPRGCTRRGISEEFSTTPPLSLYGTTKLASELLALEYAHAFDFPVWIDRCGLLAGAGQLGRADQGIMAFWVHSWLAKQQLRYIGFGGRGLQVRDCLHPHDLGELICKQMANSNCGQHRIFNVSGGVDNQFSLAQLSSWCQSRIGDHQVTTCDEHRNSDVPWLVLDSQRAETTFGWRPTFSFDQILSELLDHAKQSPNWLAQTNLN